MKKICRIRLINWHYFVNETINIKGSFLLSGENKAGKSTILDAIQFVLTTDQRKFNKAANEKSKRDLKGYVRCKTGVEGKDYIRSGAVIAYVALEFFDEKTGTNFVIGAKIDSPDNDTAPIVKWYVAETNLDNISFMTGNRPSIDEEFRLNGKKIPLTSSFKDARSHIMRRLGNLDAKFFDLLPQSVAFKPMNDVKQFINKFILPEHKLDVEPLQKNISSLDELQELMEKVAKQIEQLDDILSIKDKIDARQNELLINDILIKTAEKDKLESELSSAKSQRISLQQSLKIAEIDEHNISAGIESVEKDLRALKISADQSDCAGLIRQCEIQYENCEREYNSAKNNYNIFSENLKQFELSNNKLRALNVTDFTPFPYDDLMSAEVDTEKKILICTDISQLLKDVKDYWGERKYSAKSKIEILKDRKSRTEKEIALLKKRKISYPESTVKLKNAIESEFANANIKSSANVFCDLLEISDLKWQDAVEGYLNSQRFYIIIEPKYYDLAVNVYNRMRNEISSVGLVNTGRLDLNRTTDENTLACYVTSNNQYAKAYANYLLGRVACCDDVADLKNHRTAITSSCMLYKNLAVRKIPNEIYSVPYIGEYAVKRQLEIKTEELSKINGEIDALKSEKKNISQITVLLDGMQISKISENINSVSEYIRTKQNLASAKSKLDDARKDPTYLEIQMKINSAEKELARINDEHTKVISKNERLKIEINSLDEKIAALLINYENKLHEYSELSGISQEAAESAAAKYSANRKEKSPETIISNFSPRRKGIENSIKELNDKLIILQVQYDGGNLGTGYDSLDRYIDEKVKLERSELTKYESELAQTRRNCEIMFRQSFLAQLREQIENAQNAFKALNKSLNGIYYGEDTYYFRMKERRQKAAFYKMIMSDDNMRHEADTFFSVAFEEQYKDEISELFDKLTVSDDSDNTVMAEYTDYRNYLDYDIRITNRENEVKWFSDVYADMSGGEAQTPYYVAIAASFAQIYGSDTIRIIMLDEAFDKMDDERIESMMKFFNSMNFQIILGAPPAKIEVIGEHVDEVLMAFRNGQTSFVEEFML